VQLRGAGYGGINAFGGYNADIPEDSAAGWLAGAAYQIPNCIKSICNISL
jgi:long-chain fatty acid transport protein